VPDRLFEDAYLASLYDRLAVDRGDQAYYGHLMHSAPRVLDIGCGTGMLLHRVREAGHQGRLVGLDPAAGMLAQAKRYPGIEWVHGVLETAGFADEFDLAVMTGHAFQVLLTDDEVHAFLAAVHTALAPGGRFAFESRNPHVHDWERWTPERVSEIVDDQGIEVRVWHELEEVDGEYVTFTESFASPSWDAPKVSRSTLRFMPAEELDKALCAAGFAVDERYGYWDRCPFTHDSPEIITVASAVSP
jgi:SAM-dependent methyltransferase